MTGIQWTDETWNPVTGCSKVSAGCKNCYAEKMHKRLRAMGAAGYEKPFLAGAVFQESALGRPLLWKKPRRIFVNSMSDLFHEDISFGDIDRVFEVMRKCPQHQFQVLTKRAARMQDWHAAAFSVNAFVFPLNVWMGVSAENQEQWDLRVPALLSLPTRAPRFVSAEPLLGPIVPEIWHMESLSWVIVGGESGRKARPFLPEYSRYLFNMSRGTDTAFFFKQMGENHNSRSYFSDRKCGDLIDVGGFSRRWGGDTAHMILTREYPRAEGRK